jgi:AAA15 family ATPase/GTPase
MGQGFGKLLTIVTAMVLREAPIFLIDEISEGFHYSILSDVWRTIVTTAIEHSAQVFATTHSYECIEAAVEGSKDHKGKLGMFRLERDVDHVLAVDVDDEGLRAAMRLGFELR